MAFTKRDVIKRIVDCVPIECIEIDIDDEGYIWSVPHWAIFEYLERICDLESEKLDS